jgi:hypothetical protein
MGILKRIRYLIASARQVTAPDHVLDGWIRDALLEEAVAQPPVGAWERLCKAVAERRVGGRSYGMWVLDEPVRDPPAAPPMALSRYQFKRAQRLYDDRRHNPGQEVRETLWSNVMPTYIVVHL